MKAPAVPAPSPSPTQSVRRIIRAVFWGPDGLRAGWSAACFVVLSFALAYAFVAVLKATGLLHHPTAAEMKSKLFSLRELTAQASEVVAVLLATAIMSRVEGRTLASYGIGPLWPRLRQAAKGLLCGAVALVAVVALCVATHSLGFTGTVLQGREALVWAGMWAMGLVTVSLFEEYLYRGYLQFTLARGFARHRVARSATSQTLPATPFWCAAVCGSVLFGLAHAGNPGESRIGLVSAGLFGLFLAASLRRTGSLWFAVGMHTAWNWLQTFLFGLANSGSTSPHRWLNSHPQGAAMLSGGSAGAEGSLFTVVVLLLLGLVVFRGASGAGKRARGPLRLEEVPVVG